MAPRSALAGVAASASRAIGSAPATPARASLLPSVTRLASSASASASASASLDLDAHASPTVSASAPPTLRLGQGVPPVETTGGWRQNLRGGALDAELRGARDPARWYSGLVPSQAPGFDGRKLRSVALPTLGEVTLHQAQAYFDNGWTLYELLFSALQGEEAFYRPPDHGLRHPLVFYWNHTAVLYINKLNVAGLLPGPIDRGFESLFEVGVDEMRWDDMSKGDKAWPTIREIVEYRRIVHRTVSEVLQRTLSRTTPTKVTWDHPLWAFFMGCDHDRIHLETSSQLIREMPLEFLRKPEEWPDPAPVSKANANANANASTPPPPNTLVTIPGRDVSLGKPRDAPVYGWDNEYGELDARVDTFRVSNTMVTNAEFLEFVREGGYTQRRYWNEDGWGWRRFRNALHPHFWVEDGPRGSHRFSGVRTTFEVVAPFPASWPALVNHHEAKAFCAWKAEKEGKPGVRLLTEPEYRVLAEAGSVSAAQREPAPGRDPKAWKSSVDPVTLLGGSDLERGHGWNLALAHGSERDVGDADVRGNAWHLLNDPIEPFPGFRTHPYYEDFTDPCFDGRHYTILGGAFVTTGGCGAGHFNRFHFRPHFLQQAGFRYVVPDADADADKPGGASEKRQTQADYLDPKVVEQYSAFHFGQATPELQDATVFDHAELPRGALDFVGRCASLVSDACAVANVPKGAVLDVGCAVGGTSFALARQGFRRVVGFDYSPAFVREAQRVQRERRVSAYGASWTIPDPDHDLDRVEFHVGDAMNMADEYDGAFDVVFAGNLLCRLPDPLKFFDRLPRVVRGDGLVVLVSPFSWMDSFTPKDKQLGPEPGVGESRVLGEMNRRGFDLVHHDEVPFLLREHRRKYQYVVSHAQVFQKRG